MNRRRAFTLIEVTMAATTGVSVMIIAVTLLNQSMRLTSQSRKRMEYSQTLDRLTRQFRHDVRLAKTAELQLDPGESSAATELILTDVNETNVRYRFRAKSDSQPRIDRRVFSDGKQIGQEVFRLMPDTQAVFEQLESPRRLQLEVHTDEAGMMTTEAKAVSATTTRLDRRVTAIVGRLLDLQRVKDDQ